MSKTVLVVDDAAFMRMTLKKSLENEGFEVVAEAENGKEAVEKYKNESPDLVTMDITMPEMDGLVATEKILEFDPNARIVVVSAMGQESYIKKAIMKGAKNFIVKPFKKDKIIDTMNKALQG